MIHRDKATLIEGLPEDIYVNQCADGPFAIRAQRTNLSTNLNLRLVWNPVFKSV
jgi:hypothetical protein